MGGETYAASAATAPRARARNVRVPEGEEVTEVLTDGDAAIVAAAAAYYNFYLSYSADFASGTPNPPGSGYHWSLQQSRFSLAPAFAARLAARRAAGGAGARAPAP